ncbi:DUF4224 domain-containing protein [Tahibacter harae]|uniref:DUF4224 domain-containing protein n=1 Tax=Tahibacter harae TaxID=2963937 RepID=A0ABT1QQY5_9GAMM|nr:DUF4224 domain-containing protein [Tahibacter harae]MCQ4164682.1 DUF4224 domain-containing protein [Tahibacter harae]
MTGAKTRARQIANLRQNGIRHTINAAGWPVVARAVVEGTAAAAREPERKPWRSAALDKP